MNNDWTRTFDHEISRRRRIAQESKDIYAKIWKANPKGLTQECDCKEHCWVPATHLMIHDRAGKLTEIKGVLTRGFREASPYTEEGYTMVPQMCWYCDATRVLEMEIVSTAFRLASLKADRPKKARKRRGGPIESTFSTLFDEV